VPDLPSSPDRPDTPAPPSLGHRAVRGAVWTVVTSVGARAVGLAGTLLLTRFLGPAAYGEVSLASVVILTATTFSSCGLSQYLVSRPQAGRQAAFHATFYFTVLGLAALGVVLAAGARIGAFIHAPGIGRYLPGLAVAAALERVGVVQDRILVRDMRFRAVGLLRSFGEVVYSGLSVALAAAGTGAWWGGGNAVVIASIARSAARLCALSAVTPRREWLEPCRITWERTRDLFAFGLPMSVASLAGFGARRWDNLVFSQQFGEGAAGVYNLAYNLADIPATQIGETIGDVLVPSFAQMDSTARRRRALMLSLRQMMLLVSPLAFGLGAVAPALAQTLFDSRWAGIEVEIAILSVLSAVRPIGWIGSSYLQVANRPRAIMILESLKTVSVVGMMLLFARLAPRFSTPGEPWACAAVGLAFGLNALGYMAIFKVTEGLPLRAQLAEMGPPVVACAPMVAAVALFERTFHADVPAAARLGVEVALGAAVFVPSAFVLAPETTRELLRLLGKIRGRRGGAAALVP
jgi:lipopolysaccharide exporter